MPVSQYAGVAVVTPSSLDDGTGPIEIDLVDDVVVTEENLVTQHPTESGAALSDHIVVLPVSIRLSGRFVDFPLPDLGLGALTAFAPEAGVIGAAAAVGGALAAGDAVGRSVAMWQALEKLRASKSLVSVNIQQGLYTNMAIKTLTAPRSLGDGGSLRFQINLLEIVTTFILLATDEEAMADEWAHSGKVFKDQGVKSAPDFN